jgi:hypothetical protein
VRHFDTELDADDLLDLCRREGLVVRLERSHRTKPGSRHWHLAMPGRRGTLELTEWQGRVWLTVKDRWDGGWVSEFAASMAGTRTAD